MKIAIQEVYTVSNDNRGKPRYYRTLNGAMSRIAWWMIFDKYSWELETFSFDERDQKVTEILPPHYACECDAPRYSSHQEWEGCPIHDRETGYFKRLHDRLTSFLVSKYASHAFPFSFGPGRNLTPRETDRLSAEEERAAIAHHVMFPND